MNEEIDKAFIDSLEDILKSELFNINTEPIKIDGTLCVKCGMSIAGYCLTLGGDCPYVNICAGYRRRSKK